MKKVIRLTESDLTRIVKRVINESNAQEMANNALSKSNQADSKVKSEIIKCIKIDGLTHLKFLTTGLGAKALGALTNLFVDSMNLDPEIPLLAAAMVVIKIEGFTTGNLGKGSVTDEISQLYHCLKRKNVIE